LSFSRIALAALAAALAAPAGAQQPPAQEPARALTLTREERVALEALQAAASGADRAAQDAALAAARSAARGGDARYALAHYQLQIGRARQDPQMIAQAVDALAGSGLAPPAELASLLVNQASRAFFAGEFQRADRLLARAAELQPGNGVIVADRAQLKARLGERAEAVTLLQRAIQLQQSGGARAPESWHQRALALALEARMAPQSIALARGLVAAYPTPINWRDALLVYRQAAAPDPALTLDIGRLMRATQALSGERDYLELAQALGGAGLHGEAKAVLDEGIARGMLDPNEPIVRQALAATNRALTAERAGLARLRTQALAAPTGAPARAAGDAHFGHGRYAEAVELYRAALQKGGEDADLVNSRLGAALAMAGQRAEAEAVFRSVGGPRADLAGFWLAWLAERPA